MKTEEQLARELIEARELLDRAKSILWRVQWSQDDVRCPYCHEAGDDGHTADCEIGKLLEST